MFEEVAAKSCELIFLAAPSKGCQLNLIRDGDLEVLVGVGNSNIFWNFHPEVGGGFQNLTD